MSIMSLCPARIHMFGWSSYTAEPEITELVGTTWHFRVFQHGNVGSEHLSLIVDCVRVMYLRLFKLKCTLETRQETTTVSNHPIHQHGHTNFWHVCLLKKSLFHQDCSYNVWYVYNKWSTQVRTKVVKRKCHFQMPIHLHLLIFAWNDVAFCEKNPLLGLQMVIDATYSLRGPVY